MSLFLISPILGMENSDMQSLKFEICGYLFLRFMRQLGCADALRLLTRNISFSKTSRLLLCTPCFFSKQFKKIIIFTILATLFGMTGCSNAILKKQEPSINSINTKLSVTPYAMHDVSQVGRYSSIANIVTSSQENPLLAISQFKFSARVKTVGQALWQVLQDTGYSLVLENQLPTSAREVLSKPLPVTQRELGPISVGNALRTLMGDQVFTLIVDPVHRLVTFKLKSKFLYLKGVS